MENKDLEKCWRDFFNKADFIVDRYDVPDIEEVDLKFLGGLLVELEESLVNLETVLEEQNGE